MKKFIVSIAMLAMTLVANAQSSDTPFAKGKIYVGAGFSGLNLHYNSKSKWNFDINARGGYFIEDNWMLLGEFLWGIRQKADNSFAIGAGGRYYIVQNGLYLGAGARFAHQGSDYNDFMPNVNVGYAYFLNHHVTIEPELYFDISTKSFKDYTGVGLRVTMGVYF
jgi:hypothetical protein